MPPASACSAAFAASLAFDGRVCSFRRRIVRSPGRLWLGLAFCLIFRFRSTDLALKFGRRNVPPVLVPAPRFAGLPRSSRDDARPYRYVRLTVLGIVAVDDAGGRAAWRACSRAIR